MSGQTAAPAAFSATSEFLKKKGFNFLYFRIETES